LRGKLVRSKPTAHYKEEVQSLQMLRVRDIQNVRDSQRRSKGTSRYVCLLFVFTNALGSL